MKKFFLLIISLLVFITPNFAEEPVKETIKLQGQIEYDDNPVETIYLDENIEKPQVNIPQKTLTLPIGVLNIMSNTNTPRSALARAMVNRSCLGDILPLSDSITAHSGGITYGSKWEEELSYSQLESTASMFIRYDSPRLFSLNTSFNQSSTRDISSQYGTFRITPEWHITDKLTIKNAFTDYLDLPKNKNEVVIVYSPELKKYVDSLKLELGLAQSFYSNGRQSSALRFSTGFKL